MAGPGARGSLLVKACLNGGRQPGEHPALPCSPGELAAEADAAAEAGAGAVHVHPRDGDGRQTLDAIWVAAAVEAIRSRRSGLPVGVTTGAWIEPDPARRLDLVRAWSLRPDFASVNIAEDRSLDLARLLLEMGIGVEAGLVAPGDAEALARSGLAGGCLRVLIEPQEKEAGDALANAGAILATLDVAGVAAPRLLHGYDATAWTVLKAALELGLDVRVGLEDTLDLPDGSRAGGNADLVAAAASLAAGPGAAPSRT